MLAACPAALAAATAAGSLTPRAAAPPTKRRRISPAASSSPRAKARVRAIASRGRPSPGAFASNSPSTRSAQSAAQAATIRRSASLSVCGEPTPKFSHRRARPPRRRPPPPTRDRTAAGQPTRSRQRCASRPRRPSGAVTGHLDGPAFPREEDQLLARCRLTPAWASGESDHPHITTGATATPRQGHGRLAVAFARSDHPDPGRARWDRGSA
jgi:hypothetical protein